MLYPGFKTLRAMSGSAADPEMLNQLQVQMQKLTCVIEQMRAQLTVQASEVTAREEHIQHLQQSLAAQQAVTHVSTANATITRITSQLRPAAWAGNRKHDFDTWLFQADQYRNKAIAAIDDATAIVLVSMHFTDDAATWWRAIVEAGRTPAT
jgi:TolA-binding protein